MRVGEICTRDVVFAKKDLTVLGAAKLMREYHVGDLLIVDEPDGKRFPIGIVTDRDIVVDIVASGLDPDVIRVGDLVTRDLVTVSECEGIFETAQRMHMKGVRRVPVVDTQGALVGIVTLDDLFGLLTEEMTELAKVFTTEQKQEIRVRK